MFENEILSEDYRKFIDERRIKLSDWDKAALIYNHPMATYNKKVNALRELQKKAADEVLKQQIDECLSGELQLYDSYKINNGNAYYLLSVCYKNHYIEDGVYLNFESAYADGVKEGKSFQIKKDLFACRKQSDEKCGTLGAVKFHAQGEVRKILWLYDEDNSLNPEKNDDCSRLENQYIDLPLFFRQGDIVHIIATELYGIVDGPIDDEDELQYRKIAKKGDYTDFQVPVNLMYDGEKFLSVFSHRHVQPTELEFAKFEEDDLRKGFLIYMKKTLYDNSMFDGTGRDEKRISTILSKLETVWRQYPDMRLGQLLLNVCGNKDFFAIEDEELMKRLKYNQFPIEEN